MRQTKAKAHAIEAKHLVAEKGHAKPSNYFDFHGSVLIAGDPKNPNPIASNPNPIASLVPASVPVSASSDQLQPQGVPDHRRTQPQPLTRTARDPEQQASRSHQSRSRSDSKQLASPISQLASPISQLASRSCPDRGSFFGGPVHQTTKLKIIPRGCVALLHSYPNLHIEHYSRNGVELKSSSRVACSFAWLRILFVLIASRVAYLAYTAVWLNLAVRLD
ncbi:hypothetical protein F2Q70_00029662 [Brassica cretica]|uniref:Uncharacterized protein n=1 Tax=Brassica cretica TaxID=69181 RepID=A0A8S9FCZ6_BRACR|nr:hypothetical protein F2Q70_00029662 [Brassica cretica]KAF2552949.1 hypothetical protein F2Q68_00034101 [Brassica cretica]